MLMRLYQHSAHCSVALRAFLDANPMYGCFIPIPWNQSPTSDVPHPQPVRTVDRAQVMRCLRHVPGPPTAHSFSQRQRKMQHSFFDYFLSLDHEQQRPYQALDLFQVNIIVVRKCSRSYSPEQSDFTASLHSSARRSFDRATLCHRDDVCHSRRNEIEHDLSDRWRSKEMLWPPLSTALVHRSLQSSRAGTRQQRPALCHEVPLGMPSPSFSLLPLTFVVQFTHASRRFVFRSMNDILVVSCRFASRYSVCVTL